MVSECLVRKLFERGSSLTIKQSPPNIVSNFSNMSTDWKLFAIFFSYNKADETRRDLVHNQGLRDSWFSNNWALSSSAPAKSFV